MYKVFEALILKRLDSFLDKHKIIDNSQHGFRKNRSTFTAAIQFVDKIYEALGERERALGMFIDLSKAFDLVNHETLLNKMNSIGTRGAANNWFKSYLT
jgi:hypothetical protein